MKKIILTIFIAGILASCSDWLDVNKDPNVPTEMTTKLVLPAAEASLAVQVGGTLFNVGGFYGQYWSQAPEANQYNTVDKFDLKTDFLDNVYTELYAGALNDLEYIRKQSQDDKDFGNYYAATVLRAYTFQLISDLIDKAPYSEALQGTQIMSPKFEDGKVIYDGVIAEIDAAASLLDNNSQIASTDMLLGADIEQWKGFGNALKLKMYMRQSETSTPHKEEVKALLALNNFMSIDVAFASFANEQNKRNPWYDTEIDRLGGVNHVATKNIITYMVQNSDPRLDVIFKKSAKKGEFEGNIPGGKTIPGIKNEDFSFPLVAPTKPVYLYTMAELYLFIAEAELRYNNDNAKAKAAYEAAIDASLALHGINASGESLYGAGKGYAFDGTLKQIAMQKWASLAMVNHIEAWFETKRTDFPAVSAATAEAILADPAVYSPGDRIYPYENVLGKELFLNRFYYPDIAITRNQNSPDQVKLTDKVWWDLN